MLRTNGPGAYRRLLWLGGLCHDRQALDAGVVVRVVGDERKVVFEGVRGDPGIGYSYRASIATRAVGRFGPPEAQGAVEATSSWHPGDGTGWASFVRLEDEVCPEEVGKSRNAPSASTGIAEVV